MKYYLKLMQFLRQIMFYVKQVFLIVLKVFLGIGFTYIIIMFAFPILENVYDDYKKDAEVCARLNKEPLKDLLKNHYTNSKVKNVLNKERIDYTAKKINIHSIKFKREVFSIKSCQSVKVTFYTAEGNEYDYYIFPRAKDTGEAVFGEYNNSSAIIYISKLNGVDFVVGISKAD